MNAAEDLSRDHRGDVALRRFQRTGLVSLAVAAVLVIAAPIIGVDDDVFYALAMAGVALFALALGAVSSAVALALWGYATADEARPRSSRLARSGGVCLVAAVASVPLAVALTSVGGVTEQDGLLDAAAIPAACAYAFVLMGLFVLIAAAMIRLGVAGRDGQAPRSG